MNSSWWESLSAEERLLAEQAVLNFQALRKACAAAPDGRVLAVAEGLAVEQGRELTRRTLEQALQQEAGGVEKKGARPGPVPVGAHAETAGARSAPSSRRPAR